MKNKVEYLIIGQGLAGTMLAFEMIRNNMDFRIVTSAQKSKASLVAAGMVNPLVFKRMTKSWMVEDLLPVMRKSYSLLEKVLDTKFYFEKDILKPLSGQERELWMERKEDPEFAPYIVSIQDRTDIQSLVNAPAYGRITNSGYFNLGAFLACAEEYFRNKNLLIDSTYNRQSTGINKDVFHIDNTEASKVIYCEGFHLAQNRLFDFVQLKPVKGEVLLINAPDLSEDFILNKKVFILPLGKHLFKIGSTYDWQDLTENISEEGKQSILQRFESLVKVPYTILDHVAGVRPTVMDRRPVLGAHPHNENIYVFNGLGTKGVMLAPYFAKELISVLLNRGYAVNNEVDIKRFLGKK